MTVLKFPTPDKRPEFQTYPPLDCSLSGEPWLYPLRPKRVRRPSPAEMFEVGVSGNVRFEGVPDFDVASVVILEAANESVQDPVLTYGSARKGLVRFVERIGLPRLPVTRGEVLALFDYAEALHAASGWQFGYKETHTKSFQDSIGSVVMMEFPEQEPAFHLYFAQDHAGLKAFHAKDDTLTKIGLQFRYDRDYYKNAQK